MCYNNGGPPRARRWVNWKKCGAPGPLMPFKKMGTAAARNPFLRSGLKKIPSGRTLTTSHTIQDVVSNHVQLMMIANMLATAVYQQALTITRNFPLGLVPSSKFANLYCLVKIANDAIRINIFQH